MKRYFNFFAMFAVLAITVSSCKKDEKQVFFEGGKAPELTNMTANIDSILLRPNRNNVFASIVWTNPDYRFTTGISSQNVTYLLQVDTVSDFTSTSKQEVSISKDLSKTITVGDMNGYLTKMGLTVDVPHEVAVRIVSSINGGVKLYSNTINFSQIVMYEDFALPPPANGQLFVVGDGTSTGWNNNPGTPEFATKVSKGLYIDTITLAPGKYFKFLTTTGLWQPQYGVVKGKGDANEGDIGLNNQTPGFDFDPEAIPTPSAAGDYIVTLNFTTGKYTVKPK